MKSCMLIIAAALCWLPLASAFVAPSPFRHRVTATSLLAAVELEPEPQGGEEIVTQNTVPGCRIKKMAAAPELKSEDGDVYEFWLTAIAEAAMIQEIRTTILKDASKKANFPGFRKVRHSVADGDYHCAPHHGDSHINHH